MISIYSRRGISGRRTIHVANAEVKGIDVQPHDVMFTAADRDSHTTYTVHLTPEDLLRLARHVGARTVRPGEVGDT